MPNEKTKWLEFNACQQPPRYKTKLWQVISTEGHHILGEIKWYGAWRCYAFFPKANASLVFEKTCLRDIASFCERHTNEHKISRSAPSTPSATAAPVSPAGRDRQPQAASEGSPFFDEDLIENCIEAIRNEKRASASLLQRRLRLGYSRAAAIIDELEKRGLVGPGKGGADPREILWENFPASST